MIRNINPIQEANELLLRLWLDRHQFWSHDVDAEEVVHDAPELIATGIFGFRVERPVDIREDVPNDAGICTSDVAGVINRHEKRISVAKRFPLTAQRFTLAHEIGHLVLHPAVSLHRDRPLDGNIGTGRSRQEREADQFAAHLLMPEKFVRKVASGCLPCPIDGSVADADLAFRLSTATGKRISARELANMTPLKRAAIIASISEFGGAIFEPLARRFLVSATAMGIQLLELGLVA